MSSATEEFARCLLERAIVENAADIHLEPFENRFVIRLRTPKGLVTLPSPDGRMYLSLVRHFKLLARLDIALESLPQDGKFTLDLGAGSVEFRLSALPTLYGPSMVLRLLDRNRVPLEIDSLGFSTDIVEGLRQALDLPFGLVCVVGPTGSGKTTTLYACLRHLALRKLKIVSIEDPVEYSLPGVQQAAVSPSLDYPTALRAFLRHDPDVIFVGEIRDRPTARLAIQAALTGHLVLTTLHTRIAEQVPSRLLDLGVETSLIGAALRCVLSQTLQISPQGARVPVGHLYSPHVAA